MKSVFISHSSRDAEFAKKICTMLEDRGISCWIAPRNIGPGKDYGEEIVAGIESAVATILVLSDDSNASKAVKGELEISFNRGKTIFPIRIRDVSPSKGLELFVSSVQWIDAWQPPLEAKLDLLADSIRVLLGQPIEPKKSAPAKSRKIRKTLLIPATLAIAIGAGVYFLNQKTGENTAQLATESGSSVPKNPLAGSLQVQTQKSPNATTDASVIKPLPAPDSAATATIQVERDPRKELVARGYRLDGWGLEKAIREKDKRGIADFNDMGFVSVSKDAFEMLFGMDWDPEITKLVNPKTVGAPGLCGFLPMERVVKDFQMNKNSGPSEILSTLVRYCGKAHLQQILEAKRGDVNGGSTMLDDYARDEIKNKRREVRPDGVSCDPNDPRRLGGCGITAAEFSKFEKEKLAEIGARKQSTGKYVLELNNALAQLKQL